MDRKLICGLTPDEISASFHEWGVSSSQALKAATSLYRKRTRAVSRIEGIPRNLRNNLPADMGLFSPCAWVKSDDGTVKYLFEGIGGKKYETVFIPDGKRNTVCISCQSGCRMGCPFCATGKYGFHGELDAGEIVNQVLSIPESAVITNVVFMGMGEPMDNIENVLKACNILTAEWGLAISPLNITVSTVGIMPGIERFLAESRCNLAVSLFSPFPDERRKLVPAERKYPIEAIISFLKKYPLTRKRRISVSYVMLKGVNDTDLHLEALKKLLGGSGIRINLLPYHKVSGQDLFSSDPGRMLYFKHNLVISGISASIRKSRGSDIAAACGLLAGSE